MSRVLVESPPFPMDVVRQLLASATTSIEQGAPPWRGDDVEALLAWSPVTADDLERLPRLRVVATCSVGFDHIDVDAAARRGVWVCHVPDYCIDEVADSTIALLLALIRGVVALDRTVRAGRWDDHAAGSLRRVGGTRLGVIGFGRIGRAVAARAQALGMTLAVFDPIVTAGEASRPLDELLRTSDAITVHVPLSAQTRGLVGARELGLLPRGAVVVNTSRAGLIDQAALLAALDSGHLAGAALDVLEFEPPSRDHPPPAHPRLIVTPHSAWLSPESEAEVYRRSVLSVREVLEGLEPADAAVSPRRSRARLKGAQKSAPRT